MESVPQYLWPLVSLLGSIFGGWVGVKITVTKLETQMERMLTDVGKNTMKTLQHSEDLLVHDMELEQILHKLSLKRARRQSLRGLEK